MLTDDSHKDVYATMMGSALAGMSARVFCHPLDTAKARLQTLPSNKVIYRNGLHVLRHSLKTEGFRSWYRGFAITFWGAAPGCCLYLTTYEESKGFLNSYYKNTPSFLIHFGAGMMAETLSCLFWVPIDVIKERLQVQNNNTSIKNNGYKNTSHAIRSIWKGEGIRGIYKGYGATLLSFGPFSALYFLFYEKFKEKAQRMMAVDSVNDLPFWMIMTGSASAGAVASFCTNPLDLIKLRLQIQRGKIRTLSSQQHYTGVLDGLQKTIRTEGSRALFKGAGARMAFHAPSTAITIALYERCKSMAKEVL